METLGILVAGGRGRRLGLDRPKAAVEIGGTTLLARSLATLEAVCGRVVVAAPADLALPVPDERRVDDAAGGEGPLAGVVAALGGAPEPGALVLGVDFPRVSPAFLRALLEGLASAPAVACAPGGRLQPLVAALSAAAYAPLLDRFRAGERSIGAALRAVGVRLLDDAVLAMLPGGAMSLADVDTPDDLARARAALAPQASAAHGSES